LALDVVLAQTWWFWVAVVLGTLQGVRAIFLQRDVVRRTNSQRACDHLSKSDMIFGYMIPDFILNFFCTIAGFVALVLLASNLDSLPDPSGISIGAGLYLSVLLFVAVSGIAGVLPWILTRGIYPGVKS